MAFLNTSITPLSSLPPCYHRQRHHNPAMPALNLRCTLPISLSLSRTLSTCAGAGATLSAAAITPSAAKASSFPLALITNLSTTTHAHLQQRSLLGGGVTVGVGGPTSPRARLASPAHVKAPRSRIITPPFSSSSSPSIFASVGGSSSSSSSIAIAVNPIVNFININKRAPFPHFAFSSQGGRGVGDSDPGMGVDYSQNGDGSPRLSKLEQEEKDRYSRFLTLPTVLTLGRVAAVPAFVFTFYVNSWWGPTTTTSIFIAAAVTDWLDGYLARKMQQGTAFGAFLDPVADKLMVAATLILLCSRPLEVPMFGNAAWIFPVPSIAIIGREITMSAVREWAASQKGKLSEAVAVNSLGKWKTATQMISLTILLACRDSSLGGTDILIASGVVLLYTSAWLAVWSLVVYMRNIWKVLLK